jgi:hypothetical protein
MERVQPAELLSTSPRKRLLQRHRSSSAIYKVAIYMPKLANTRFPGETRTQRGRVGGFCESCRSECLPRLNTNLLHTYAEPSLTRHIGNASKVTLLSLDNKLSIGLVKAAARGLKLRSFQSVVNLGLRIKTGNMALKVVGSYE